MIFFHSQVMLYPVAIIDWYSRYMYIVGFEL